MDPGTWWWWFLNANHPSRAIWPFSDSLVPPDSSSCPQVPALKFSHRPLQYCLHNYPSARQSTLLGLHSLAFWGSGWNDKALMVCFQGGLSESIQDELVYSPGHPKSLNSVVIPQRKCSLSAPGSPLMRRNAAWGSLYCGSLGHFHSSCLGKWGPPAQLSCKKTVMAELELLSLTPS